MGIRQNPPVPPVLSIDEREVVARLNADIAAGEPGTVTISASLLADLAAHCLLHGERIGDVVADAIALHLDELAAAPADDEF